MSAKPKDLPIGIQTFENLIQGNYIYVDKTKHLYELVKGEQGVYFLSRPRRFGKSLLVSTLSSIFKGDKELFKNLWIYDSDYTWEKHPVIKLSMANSQVGEADTMETRIKIQLNYIAEEYGIELDLKPYVDIVFTDLIHKLHQKTGMKVVVLVDEYDGPIINHINDIPKANENRDLLRNFYKVLKEEDNFLRFVFITGVSKFAKVSIFSGLNNLSDLSMNEDFASLCGYTQSELESYFSEHLDKIVEKFKNRPQDLELEKASEVNKEQILAKTRFWYNGFRFTKDTVTVYNPFSILEFLKNKDFTGFWFATATPDFLIQAINSQEENIKDLDGMSIESFSLDTYSVDNLDLVPIFFHTGYLTIQDYRVKSSTSFQFTYPNFEVKQAFLNSFLSFNLIDKSSKSANLERLAEYIQEGNISDFIEILKEFFLSLNYYDHIKKEKYYQGILYTILYLTGLKINSEEPTSTGRIDLVLKTDSEIYLFELKLNQSAKAALEQIHKKKYHEKYLSLNTKITLIGLNFNSEIKNIDEYLIESVN